MAGGRYSPVVFVMGYAERFSRAVTAYALQLVHTVISVTAGEGVPVG